MNYMMDDYLWELMGESTEFKQFVQFCISMFECEDLPSENRTKDFIIKYPVPDDIDNVYSNVLYFVYLSKEKKVIINTTGKSF